MTWTKEDVYHLDVLIVSALEGTEGLTALPGVEHIRNRIAAQVGIAEAEQGAITWELVRETDYGSHYDRPPPTMGAL